MASAAAIQRAMLPATQPGEIAAARFDVHPFMTPAREVGGDLYDIVRLDETRVLLSIGDVCGKGIPASLFMAITQTVMRLAVRHRRGPRRRGDRRQPAARRRQCRGHVHHAVLRRARSRHRRARPGATPATRPRWCCGAADGAFEQLRVGGPPLGIVETAKYVPQTVTLAPGDLLFLYSDGVTEAENPASDLFGAERLEQALLEARGRSAREVVEHVVRRVTEFATGAPQSDDITCMAVVRTP